MTIAFSINRSKGELHSPDENGQSDMDSVSHTGLAVPCFAIQKDILSVYIAFLHFFAGAQLLLSNRAAEDWGCCIAISFSINRSKGELQSTHTGQRKNKERRKHAALFVWIRFYLQA